MNSVVIGTPQVQVRTVGTNLIHNVITCVHNSIKLADTAFKGIDGGTHIAAITIVLYVAALRHGHHWKHHQNRNEA
jgi:hypothetical protein